MGMRLGVRQQWWLGAPEPRSPVARSLLLLPSCFCLSTPHLFHVILLLFTDSPSLLLLALDGNGWR